MVRSEEWVPSKRPERRDAATNSIAATQPMKPGLGGGEAMQSIKMAQKCSQV